MAHGTHDPRHPAGARPAGARALLTALGYRVEWHEYPMPHSVCAAEIRDIGAWLTADLGLTTAANRSLDGIAARRGKVHRL